MSKPPSYRIIRRAYADGRERFVVSTNRFLWILMGWIREGAYCHMPGEYEPIRRYDTQEEAERACRKHWQRWLSKQELFNEEMHFDPEATCTP